MAEGEVDPSDADAQAKADLAEIPKIPYARGLKLSTREIMRIAMLVGTLVLLLVMQQPCAQAVSSFVSGFDTGSNTAAAPARPRALPAVGSNAVHLPAGMTDDQMKSKIDTLRGGSAAGSAQ
jgi:hypothetical protein